MRIWKEGDRLEAVCERCGDVCDATYRYRTVRLRETGVDVPNVLVGICDVCDEVVAIPDQSAPRLKEARERQTVKVPLRMSRELDDVLHLVADRFQAAADLFTGMLVRYYLHEARTDPELLSRAARLAHSPLATQPQQVRASFYVGTELLETMDARMREAGIAGRSELIRGLIIAAKEDLLDDRAPRRKEELKQIAAVAA